MKTILLTLFLVFSTNQLMASETVKVTVKGMVCAFCVNGVEKKFKSQKEVEHIHVDMDTKIVTIKFKDGQRFDNEKISKLVTASGFAVDKIN